MPATSVGTIPQLSGSTVVMLCSFSIAHDLTYYTPAVVGKGTFRVALDRSVEVCDRHVKLSLKQGNRHGIGRIRAFVPTFVSMRDTQRFSGISNVCGNTSRTGPTVPFGRWFDGLEAGQRPGCGHPSPNQAMHLVVGERQLSRAPRRLGRRLPSTRSSRRYEPPPYN